MLPILTLDYFMDRGSTYAHRFGDRYRHFPVGGTSADIKNIRLSEHRPWVGLSTSHSSLPGSIFKVVFMSTVKKMVRIYTSWVVTGVAHFVFGPDAMREKPGCASGNVFSLLYNKSWAIHSIEGLPLPTATGRIDCVQGVKSIYGWYTRTPRRAAVRAIEFVFGRLSLKYVSAILTAFVEAGVLRRRLALSRAESPRPKPRGAYIELDSAMLAGDIWGTLRMHMRPPISCAMPRVVRATPGLLSCLHYSTIPYGFRHLLVAVEPGG